MARYGDQDVADTLEAIIEFGERLDIVRKVRSRQIARVYPLLAYRCELGTIAPPEPDRPPAARELQRERGAPGARAEDRNRL